MKNAQEKDKVSKVLSKFYASAKYQAPYRTQWDKNLRLWECILDNLTKLKNHKRSHLFIPYAFTLSEWIIQSLITKIESVHPMIKLIPTGATEPTNALRNEQLLDYQLHLSKTNIELEDATRQIVLHGDGALFVNWDGKDRSHLGLGIEWIDIYNLYPDPKATSFEKCEWIIRRMERSLDYLLQEEKKGNYKNITKIKEKLKNSSIAKLNKEATINKGIKQIAKDEYVIELLEYWNKYTKEWMIVAGREFLILDEKNPFKHQRLPFAISGLYRRPGVLYHKGVMEALEDQQHELNAERNLRRDQEKLTVKRMLKVMRSAHINKKQIQDWLSGGILYVTSQNDVESLQLAPLPPEAYRSPAELKVEMQDTVGAQDYARGVTPPRQELATTTLLIQRAAQVKMTYSLRAVALLLNKVAELATSNNIQFLKSNIPESVLTPRVIQRTFFGLPLGSYKEFKTSKDLIGSFDFRPQLHLTVMDKAEKFQKALLLYDKLREDPYVSPEKRLKFLLESAEISDPEQWYTSQPNVVPGQNMGGAPMGGGFPARGINQGEPEQEPGAAPMNPGEIANILKGAIQG